MNITELTVHELQEKLASKELTITEITKAYADRIAEKENDVQAFVTTLTDEAIKKAEEIEEKVKNGELKSNFAGIPIGIKDNLCTKGVKTTCSSKMLENFVAPYDATVIEKLNDEGMIDLGKLNMDEFAMGGSTETSAFKKTRNPWNLNTVPGGSSGGSAAAVAAGMVPWALGSDTGGSIRQPSAFCGVVGLKPTYGLVSRYGLVAFASSLDQIGPITKDVYDSAMLLNLIVGHDSKDTTSIERPKVDYTKALKNDVKGLKIGVPKEFFGEGINEEVKAKLQEAIEKYKELGAEVEEFSLDVAEYALATYYIIACAEASSNLGRFDGIRYGYRTENFEKLKDIYVNSRSEGFGPEVKRRIILGTYVLSSGYYDAYYKKAQQVRTLVTNEFEKAFEKYPHPKAVIVVHLYGTPAKIEEIKAICDKHGVPLVEDAAESLGSTYKGKETGTFGKYGIYSFNGNKIITTSGGGMLVSEDEEKIAKVRFWSTQSREKARHYEHKEIGYNYRMSNIVAGIGRGQLKVIDLRIKQKTDIYNRYKEAFNQIPDIEMQPTPVDTVPNHWLSVITLKANSKVKPLDIMEALEKENIESRPVWKPMHMQPVFAKCDFIKVADKAVSEDLFTRGVCLPSDTKMTEEEQNRVIKTIIDLWK